MTITTTQACEIFGVDKSTLTHWKRLGADAAYPSRNKWDLKRLILWWSENIYQGSTPDEAETLAAAKNRYWTAKALREEMKAKVEAGELAPISEFIDAEVNRLLVMKAAMMGQGDRLSPILEHQDHDTIARILNDDNWMMLDNYSKTGKFIHDIHE